MFDIAEFAGLNPARLTHIQFFNMVFVAEWFRRKFVALVYASSSLVEHPNMKKRKFYRIAEKRFPNEKDRGMLKLLAEGIRIGGEKEPTKEEMGF